MRNTLHRYLTAATWVYFSVLFGWLVIYLASGDRFGLVSVINLYPQPTSVASERLMVMTYNLLGWQAHTSRQIATIRHENPDVVLLQEVNPTMAVVLQSELLDE